MGSRISTIDFDVKYCGGRTNANADALKRMTDPIPNRIIGSTSMMFLEIQQPETSLSVSCESVYGTQTLATYSNSQLQKMQTDDPNIGRFLQFLKRNIPPLNRAFFKQPKDVRKQ